MRIPVWMALAAAAFVIIFGVYRVRLGLTASAEQEEAMRRRGGLYGMGKRFHLFVGVIYIVMGGLLTAMAFGWHPLAGQVGPKTEAPTKDKAPTQGNVPADGLPAKK